MPPGYEPVARLMAEDRALRRQGAEEVLAGAREALLPALVDALFFTVRPLRGELLEVLTELTGESRERYLDWVEYVGGRQDLEPAPGYAEWKATLLGRIDPGYQKIFYPGAPARIRLEEVVSGGVRLDGIPALEQPPTVSAAEARYLRKSERVFGVLLEGEARAYPLRFLSWHEMLNDTVGGRPVTLSFCTLCGSGILYDASTPAGGAYTFGTSGLLYRSNKLMYDRQGYSLWSNLTGEPVVGRLAGSPARLAVLPMTLTTWRDWVERHPATRVLDLEALRRQYPFDYRPGAADRARAGVSFPVWLRSDRLAGDDEVFTLRLGGAAKAYPVAAVLAAGVVNDELGGEPLVLVGDPGSEAVRAYRRGVHRFRAAPAAGRLLDEEGRAWRVAEGGLEPPAAELEPLERLAGHVAFWFGWYAFYPQTEVWAP